MGTKLWRLSHSFIIYLSSCLNSEVVYETFGGKGTSEILTQAKAWKKVCTLKFCLFCCSWKPLPHVKKLTLKKMMMKNHMERDWLSQLRPFWTNLTSTSRISVSPAQPSHVTKTQTISPLKQLPRYLLFKIYTIPYRYIDFSRIVFSIWIILGIKKDFLKHILNILNFETYIENIFDRLRKNNEVYVPSLCVSFSIHKFWKSTVWFIFLFLTNFMMKILFSKNI